MDAVSLVEVLASMNADTNIDGLSRDRIIKDFPDYSISNSLEGAVKRIDELKRSN